MECGSGIDRSAEDDVNPASLYVKLQRGLYRCESGTDMPATFSFRRANAAVTGGNYIVAWTVFCVPYASLMYFTFKQLLTPLRERGNHECGTGLF